MNEGYLQTKISQLNDKVNELINKNILLKNELKVLKDRSEKQDETLSKIYGIDQEKIYEDIDKYLLEKIGDEKETLLEKINLESCKYIDKTLNNHTSAIKHCMRLLDALTDSINKTKLFERVDFSIELHRFIGGALCDKKIFTHQEMKKIRRSAEQKSKKYIKQIS